MTFTEYIDENITRVRLKKKSTSWFMRFLGGCLGLLKKLGMSVPSRKEFMRDYVTTIGKTIYYGEKWPPEAEPTPLEVHELCHVLQFRSFWMPIRYLLSPTWRAYYETSCVQAEAICFPEAERGEAWFDNRVKQFVGYGIRESLVTHALLSRLRGIDSKDIDPNAHKIYVALALYKNAK